MEKSLVRNCLESLLIAILINGLCRKGNQKSQAHPQCAKYMSTKKDVHYLKLL